MPESSTKKIRVVRTATIKRTEFVDLEITRPEREHTSHERIAEELVRASIKAGQRLDWIPQSEVVERYPAPEIDAEEPEIVPAPPPIEHPEAE